LKPINNEKGAVLVVALIIMGVLAVIGTAIIMTSSIELNIAQNDKVAKTAFNRAENGRVIAAMAAEAAAWGIHDPDDVSVENELDVRVWEDGALSADLDIDKTETSLLPGGSAEFGSGYEGAGAAGGMQTKILVDSIGREPSGATTRIKIHYMLIPR
jgi:hypothetical protein